MGNLVKWHGAGLSNGATISTGSAGTGDTAVTLVTGNAPIVDTTQAKSPALKFSADGSNASFISFYTGSSQTAFRATFYFKTPAAWQATSAPLLSVFSGGSTPCIKFVLAGSGSPGQTRISNNANTNVSVSPNGTLALDTEYRVEFFCNMTAGTAQYLLYTGENAASFYDSGAVSSTFGTSYDRFFWGPTNALPVIDIYLAHLIINDDVNTLIGPYPPVAAPVTPLITWHAAGLSNGTALTVGSAGTGDTPVSLLTGNAPVVDTTQTKSPALKFSPDGTNASFISFILVSSLTAFRATFYFKTPASWQSTASPIFTAAFDASTGCMKLSLAGSGSPGQFRLVNNANQNVNVTPNGTLALNTEYRVECLCDLSTGTAQYLLYSGESTTSFYDSGSVSSTYGTSIGRFLWGPVNITPVFDIYMAHLTVTSDLATAIGPYPAVTPGTSTIAIWNGTTEVPATSKIWNGTSEVSGTVSIL